MKSYYSALKSATELCNMPDPESSAKAATEFIKWSEDICELLANIYERDYDSVVLDLQERLSLIEDE